MRRRCRVCICARGSRVARHSRRAAIATGAKTRDARLGVGTSRRLLRLAIRPRTSWPWFTLRARVYLVVLGARGACEERFPALMLDLELSRATAVWRGGGRFGVLCLSLRRVHGKQRLETLP